VEVVTQDSAPEKFWKALGTTRKEGQKLLLQRIDDLHASNVNRVFRVEKSGFTQVAQGSEVGLVSLQSDRVMIVDFCHVVYVWVGEDVRNYKAERDDALARGVEYLRNYSSLATPLIRVLEGHEGDTFNDLLL
jgi:hypothetical protein